jgi:hypothetical protein
MNKTFECEYCHSFFSTKYNLANHQQHTKKCLRIQNNSVADTFKCIKCCKIFTKKQNLSEHLKKCNVNIGILHIESDKENAILKTKLKEKEKENEELKQQIKELQSRLGDIAEIGAKKNTNVYRVNANIVNQLIPYDLNREKINAIVDEKFTENHLYAKENGIANFAVNNLLQEDGILKLTCTDTARKLFMYKDKEGNLYKDPNASGFLETYIPAVKRKSYEIISDKDGEDVVELTECVMTIEPSTLSTKLANKLIPKPILKDVLKIK